MNAKNSRLLMDATKKEINQIRENAAKKNQRISKFPEHIWENVSALMGHYSRSEIMSNLSICASQYSKAMGLSKAEKIVVKRKELKVKKQFLDISNSLIPHSVSIPNQNISIEKRIVLEIKTKNGNIISVYE